MNNITLQMYYKKAYRELENATPLKFDCGLLCGRKCCSGGNEAGMCLFPEEEQFLSGCGSFFKIRKEKLLDREVDFAVCRGTCNRRVRPLACRIFPYTPYLDADGRLTVIEDPRAKYICPLLWDSFEYKIDKLFKRKVLKVFQLLLQDREVKGHVARLSRVLDEYGKFVR